MKAFVITIPDHEASQAAAQVCIESSQKVGNDFDIEIFDAVVPRQVNKLMRDYRIQWKYPWVGEEFDFKTGLKKTAYPTVNRDARVACALSHYSLWTACAHGATPYLIMEHDSKFTAKLDYNIIESSKFLIIGINNPMYATRKAQMYKDKIEEQKNTLVCPVPHIDSYEVPQGLAGNSAYIIQPAGANKMLKLVEEHGLWPNDALMCRQLFPKLGVTTKFYTQVQGIQSTTSR